MDPKTAVLLIGFGGPVKPEEVRPFIQSVALGKAIPEERLKEVARHYEAVGGASPYNASALKLKKALEASFKGRGALNRAPTPPVYLAFRHSKPGFEEVFLALGKQGIEKAITFVLSAFRCEASFDRYLEALSRASVEIVVTEPFHTHPLFIESQSSLIQEKPDTFYLFTAHSVPCEMSDKSGYADQFAESARLVAEKMELKNWELAYQSRGDAPRRPHGWGDPVGAGLNPAPTWVPWLEPDVNDVIRQIDSSKFQNVVIIPIGFLLENVEILYDLDIEARQTAEQRGLRYWRTPVVAGEPKFVEMTRQQVLSACRRGGFQTRPYEVTEKFE